MKHPLFFPINTHFRSISISTLEETDLHELATIMYQDKTIYHSKYQLNSISKIRQWLEKSLNDYHHNLAHAVAIKTNGNYAGIMG